MRLYSGRSVHVYRERELLTRISSGDLYITTKRIVFNGNKKSTNTNYSKVVDIKEFQDGIEIFKSSGKRPGRQHFSSSRNMNAEEAALLLMKVDPIDGESRIDKDGIGTP